MGRYLTDSERHIVGIVEEMRGKSMLYTEKGHDLLGYNDVERDITYDAYGRAIGEGDRMQDLLYFPHRLRFPLPEPSRVKFSTYHLRISGAEGKGGNFSSGYWDDGKCHICGKHGNTCRVQGLPGMCESCYRMFSLYSKNDSLDLERKSTRTPVTEVDLRKAIDIAKAPFIAASEAADVAMKAAMWEAGKEVLQSFSNGSEQADYEIETTVSPQRDMNPKQNITQSQTRKKKHHIFGRIIWTIVVLIVLTYFLMILCVVLAGFDGSI